MKTVTMFAGQHCVPCKIMKPVIEEACAEAGVLLEVEYINASSPAVERYGIRAVPTFFVVSDGNVVKFSGVKTKEEVLEFING